MKFSLICVSGPSKGKIWRLEDTHFLIGRNAECQICVVDVSVSRKHCRIYLDNGELRFEDIGSRNPALVNGAPVRTALLRPGDEIAVGREIFMVGTEISGLLDVPELSSGAGVSDTNDDPVLAEHTDAPSGKPRPLPRT